MAFEKKNKEYLFWTKNIILTEIIIEQLVIS